MPEQQKIDETIESSFTDKKKLKKLEQSSTAIENDLASTLDADSIDQEDVIEEISNDDLNDA